MWVEEGFELIMIEDVSALRLRRDEIEKAPGVGPGLK